MAIIYYAKININSNIFDVYKNKIEINDILNNLYESLNEHIEYKKINSCFKDENGNLVETTETYCFSDLEKSFKFNDPALKYRDCFSD